DGLRPGVPRPRDLARREGSRRRPLAEAVLRDGAAPLPRHPRPVHDQRPRRPRVVLRELPRPPARRREPGLRYGIPLLPRHVRALAAGRRDPRLGEPPRTRPPQRPPWPTSPP